MVYRDGKTGPTLAKHFTIGGVTRDKGDLTKGKPGSRVFSFLLSSEGGEMDAVKSTSSQHHACERPTKKSISRTLHYAVVAAVVTS